MNHPFSSTRAELVTELGVLMQVVVAQDTIGHTNIGLDAAERYTVEAAMAARLGELLRKLFPPAPRSAVHEAAPSGEGPRELLGYDADGRAILEGDRVWAIDIPENPGARAIGSRDHLLTVVFDEHIVSDSIEAKRVRVVPPRGRDQAPSAEQEEEREGFDHIIDDFGFRLRENGKDVAIFNLQIRRDGDEHGGYLGDVGIETMRTYLEWYALGQPPKGDETFTVACARALLEAIPADIGGRSDLARRANELAHAVLRDAEHEPVPTYEATSERLSLARQVRNIHEGGAATPKEAVAQRAAFIRCALELSRSVLGEPGHGNPHPCSTCGVEVVGLERRCPGCTARWELTKSDNEREYELRQVARDLLDALHAPNDYQAEKAQENARVLRLRAETLAQFILEEKNG